MEVISNGESIFISVEAPTVLATNPRKQIGLLAGKLTVPEDFDAPLPDDVLADFERNS